MMLTIPEPSPPFVSSLRTVVSSLVRELKETPSAAADIKRKWFSELLVEITNRKGSSCSNEYFDTMVRLNSSAIKHGDYILVPIIHHNIVALGYRGTYETWNKIFYVGP